MSEATEEEVMEIAGRLTEKQKRWLLDRNFAPLIGFPSQVFLPVQTWRVLEYGLVTQTKIHTDPLRRVQWNITPLGRRVASVLGDAK